MGSWLGESDPARLEKFAGVQLAFPAGLMPVAQLLPLHCEGAAARAVAVAALPVVLLVMVVGRSADANVRKEGFPFEPLGAAKNVLTVWLPNPAPVRELHEGSLPLEVRKVFAPPMASRLFVDEW